MKIVKQHPQATTILIAFIILAIIYSIATPPFEAGDESRHYAVVKYMADTGRLIIQNHPDTADLQHHWSHEGNQPPLYYALGVALTFWVDTDDWDDTFWYNPHTTIGNPLRADNKNITIHPPGETWPWRGDVLALQLIRLLSIVMAAVTVTACYAIALSLFGGNRWLAAGAMAVTAFNPMFIFVSSAVNNDNAVIMFVTLALWVMAMGVTEQKSGNRKLSPYLLTALLGLFIGLGALSKLYALGLLPVVGVFLIWLAFKNRPHFWRNAILWNLTLVAVVALVAGWFYLRNAVLYDGDFLALQVMRDTAGQREQTPTLATLRAEFEGFRIAYWALFGGVNILVDSWIYGVLDWVSLIAVVGVTAFIVVRGAYYVFHRHSAIISHALRATHHISIPTFFILLGWYLIMVAGFIIWNLTQPAGQGRLFYPAIAAISALGMLGLTWWLPRRGQMITAVVVSVGLCLFALLSPFLYIIPAYARPPLITQSKLPANLTPVDFTYDGKMRLIGYQLHTPTIHPAEALGLTLFWEVLQPMDLDYSTFIHLLGRQREVIGQLDSYPGGGKWPTTLLSPGDILVDTYHVAIKPEAELNHAPTQLLIAVGIYDLNELGLPGKPVTNANSESVEPTIGSAKLIPWQWPVPNTSRAPINFFDKVTLTNHKVDTDAPAIKFTWQVNQPLDTDYTVFIQLWQEGQHIAGFDGPPVQGNYPTSLWESGEVVVDIHPLDLSTLPSGEYELLIGLYNPATGERLPAFGPDGPLQDYALNIGKLEVQQ